MSINENQKIELFEDFYDWLKADGLKAFRSERLHKKKIFAALIANNEMTIANFNDFLEDYHKSKIRALKGKTLLLAGNPCFIDEVEFLNAQNDFKLISNTVVITCKATQIKQIKKLEII